MTKALAEIAWLLGLAGWYVIRHPFERRARKVRISRSLFDWREGALLGAGFLGLLIIPAIYVASGFPAAFERPFVPAVAWLGLVWDREERHSSRIARYAEAAETL